MEKTVDKILNILAVFCLGFVIIASLFVFVYYLVLMYGRAGELVFYCGAYLIIFLLSVTCAFQHYKMNKKLDEWNDREIKIYKKLHKLDDEEIKNENSL